MPDPKKAYEPPAILADEEIITNAGSGGLGIITLNPLEAEIRGLDWPVESDYLTPKE
jgi:hypothetical protein